MSDLNRLKEHIKSVMIAVLFITAILLLSFFWSDGSGLGSLAEAFQEDDSYAPGVSELIRPEQIVVNFGSDTYTVLDADWPALEHGLPAQTGMRGMIEIDEETRIPVCSTEYDYICSLTDLYLSQSDINHEKIEKAQYDEVMSYPSITAVFDYGLPFRDFLENSGISVPAGVSDVAYLSKISFSSASSENIFIYDPSQDVYFRFVISNEELAGKIAEELTLVIDGIEESGTGFYYSLENLAGIDSDTLIPLHSDRWLNAAACRSELSINSTSEISRYEAMFFPLGLDFVRKISENKGTLLYSYGLSQKVLTLDESGSISYKEEIDQTQYHDISFYEGLNTAVQYVSGHGGWSLMKGKNTEPYLKNACRIASPDGKYNGYRYEFGVSLAGIPVMYDTGSILRAEVYGSQITSYDRDMISIEDADENNGDAGYIMDAINVITDGSREMARMLDNMNSSETDISAEYDVSQPDTEISDEETFERIARSLDRICLCMVRDRAYNRSAIVPAWYLDVDGVSFWCSITDGHIMACSSGEVG